MISGMPTVLGVIKIGIDPIVFHIGGLAVHWYGVLYAVAFLAAWRFGVVPYLVPRGVSPAIIERGVAWTILFGLIGGRLYYVVQNNALDYLKHPQDILAVWQGGMAFFGAIIASIATILVLSRRHRLNFWLMLDAGVLFATVGQPIGRIGNIINGDILGHLSSLPWATAYTNQNAVLQPGFSLCTAYSCPAYQPAAVYEMLATLLILAVLVVLWRRGVRPGILGLTYLVLYPVSQIVVFQWRAGLPQYAGLYQAQWTAVAVLLCVPPVVWLWRRRTFDFSGEEGTPASPGQDPQAPPAESAPERPVRLP